MTDTTKIQTIEPGCYIDGHWGIYGIERLHEVACNLIDGYYGTDKANDDGAIIHLSLNGNDGDTVTLSTGEVVTLGNAYEFSHELYDELTEALPTNDDDEAYWSWHDGELLYGFDPDDDEHEDEAKRDVGVVMTDTTDDETATVSIEYSDGTVAYVLVAATTADEIATYIETKIDGRMDLRT